jgi:tryptophan synthase alpha chain
MKNGIDSLFKKNGGRRKALIAYLTAGYPSLNAQRALVKTLINSDIDILELGVPFSDPIADGPTIQYSSHEALMKGISLHKIIEWLTRFKREITVPVVLMSYMNPILSYGIDAFSRDAQKAGVSGLIIPDSIPEENKEIKKVLERRGIHLIALVAPTTPEKRLRWVSTKTAGFLYAVSVAGVTGARKNISPQTKRWLSHLRSVSPSPVCVGFGISTKDHIASLRGSVDGFIVGSALIELIRNNRFPKCLGKLKTFVSTLSKECHYGRGK